MGNMRKKIAFLAGAISFDNQNRVIDGVLRRAAGIRYGCIYFLHAL